jgi:hypothetical protein
VIARAVAWGLVGGNGLAALAWLQMAAQSQVSRPFWGEPAFPAWSTALCGVGFRLAGAAAIVALTIAFRRRAGALAVVLAVAAALGALSFWAARQQPMMVLI